MRGDLKSENLKGLVKSVKEIKYQGSENFGEITKIGHGFADVEKSFNEDGNIVMEMHLDDDGWRWRRFNYKYVHDEIGNVEMQCYNGSDKIEDSHRYNIRGNVIEIKHYDKNEDIRSISSYKYNFDDIGNEIEKKSYDENGKLSFVHKYKYDELRNKIEEEGNKIEEKEGSMQENLRFIYKFRFDADGNKIHKQNFNGDMILSSFCKYEYDDKSNIIEERDFNKNETIINVYRYKYDAVGNLDEEEVYESNGQRSSKATYKYDEYGNWIVKIERHDIHSLLIYIEREIEYYN